MVTMGHGVGKGEDNCMGKGRHNIEKGIHGIGDMGSLH